MSSSGGTSRGTTRNIERAKGQTCASLTRGTSLARTDARRPRGGLGAPVKEGRRELKLKQFQIIALLA
jgi:hypothetical protein